MSKVSTGAPAGLGGEMASTITAGNNHVFTSQPLTGSLAFGDGAGGYSPTGVPLSPAPSLSINNPNSGIAIGSSGFVDSPIVGPLSNYAGGLQPGGQTQGGIGLPAGTVSGEKQPNDLPDLGQWERPEELIDGPNTTVNFADPATSGGRVRTADGGTANASNLVNYLTVASIIVGLLVALT